MSFGFSPENVERAAVITARYPEGRHQSAVMPLLDLAQRQAGGWLPREVLDYIADYLDMPRIRVYEVATFYEMFNLEPVGEHVVRVCTTTPCMLCGAGDVLDACKDELRIDVRGTTDDGKFTLLALECLGSCDTAPVALINGTLHENLTIEKLDELIEGLK